MAKDAAKQATGSMLIKVLKYAVVILVLYGMIFVPECRDDVLTALEAVLAFFKDAFTALTGLLGL